MGFFNKKMFYYMTYSPLPFSMPKEKLELGWDFWMDCILQWALGITKSFKV